MDLTFAADFTTSSPLDAGLTGQPDSNIYWNRGVHPTLTVSNLLALLPHEEITFTAYAAGTTYTKFETSRLASDVVSDGDDLYLSLQAGNIGNALTETAYWLPTNIDSIRIRSFLWTVEDNAVNALNLTRKLIENQYIYNVGKTTQTFGEDFIGWAFEPKGSDYVKIRINQISLQAKTTDPVNLFVINQGVLIDTIVLNPNNGLLAFEDVNHTIYGKDRFLFVIAAQDVLSDNAYNDPLKYNGFVCYPVTGTGTVAKDAEYSFSSAGNGFGFNVTALLDSSAYVANNKIDLAKFRQSQFEYDFFRMGLGNSNAQSNKEVRIMINRMSAEIELFDLKANTVGRRYMHEKKIALDAISLTFDKFIKKPKRIRVSRRTI